MPYRPSALALTLATSCTVAAVVIGMLCTHHGIGVFPDSVTYLVAAKHAALGQGFTVLNDRGEQMPLANYPPLYPFLLALLARLGLTVEAAARGLQVVLFGVEMGIFSIWLRRLSASIGGRALTLALLLTAVQMLIVHSCALTEPLFLCLGFGGLLGLLEFLRTGRRRWLVLSAGAISLCMVTRYAGIAFGLTGGLLLALESKSGRAVRRRLTGLGFLALCLVPLVLWSIGHGSKALGDRQFHLHALDQQQRTMALQSLGEWLNPLAPRQTLQNAGICLIALGILIAAARRKRSLKIHWRNFRFEHRALMFFAALYLGFILFSLTFLDAHILQNETRVLLPFFLAAALLFFPALVNATAAHTKAGLRTAGALLIAFWLLSYGTFAWQWVYHAYREGIGFHSLGWRRSPIIATIQTLPESIFLYTNAPDAVYFLTGHPARALPSRYDPLSHLSNPRYDEEMRTLKTTLHTGNAAAAYFATIFWRTYAPTLEEITADQAVIVLAQSPDGLLFRFAGDRRR